MPDLTHLEARLDNLEKRVRALESSDTIKTSVAPDGTITTTVTWREDDTRGAMGQL